MGQTLEAANIGIITAEDYIERTATRMKLPAATVQAIIEEAFASDLFLIIRHIKSELWSGNSRLQCWAIDSNTIH